MKAFVMLVTCGLFGVSGLCRAQAPTPATPPASPAALTVVLNASSPASDSVRVGTLVPREVSKGAQVSIDGDSLPVVSSVELCRDSDVACNRPYVLPNDESTSKNIKFHVPPFVPPGSYRVRVLVDLAKTVYRYTAVELDVKRVAPLITALSVKTLYPTDFAGGSFEALRIFGSGFASPAANEINILRLNGIPLVPCTVTPPSLPDCDKTLVIQGNESSISVKGLPRSVDGPVKLEVVVGNQASNQIDLLLSGVPHNAPRVAAWLALVVILLLLYALNRRKVTIPEDTVETPTARIPRWKTIFIDFDSNTYSLSRVQLVIWTFVALFGWIYLSVARSFVQGMVTFSDIPDGLPGVLVVSVGTTVAAGGVSAFKGGKSAGPFSPALSDLWSIGGIIAPERFQFFIWTVVGAAGFLAYTVALDPASIQTLPTLPNGFLQLAGISAAGYVGGKLVRKAGPVLSNVQKTVDTANNSITWTLIGSGLAQNATFALKLATATGFEEKPLTGVSVNAEPADRDSDPTLFKKLTVVMKDPPSGALDDTYVPPAPTPGGATATTSGASASQPTGSQGALQGSGSQGVSQNTPDSSGPPHTRLLVVINPDGQRAEWPY
jgi:hypothetical protein